MLVIFLLALLQYSLAATPICTNGFQLVNDKCLRYFGTSTNHQTAERTCMNYGATLVTIRNAIDNRGVQTVSGTSTNSIWMGLYCFGNDVTRCLWDDASGDSSAYSNFMAGYPQVQTGKCVFYSLSSSIGKWGSSDCENTTRPFVCELPTSYQDDCGNNYNGFCYTHYSPSPFVSAQETCEQQCGNLVSIHSANENRYLNSLFLQSQSGSLLIGATRSSRNSFSWFDGSLWSYSNLDTSAVSSGNCVAMSFGTSNNVSSGAWYTVDCSTPFGFMCKRPAGVQCPANPPQVTVTPVPSNPSYCNSSLLMAPGTITSPNYPRYYDNSQYCMYQLATLGAYNILLKFTFFSTEKSFDYVTVRDGDSSISRLIGNYSGPISPFSLVSSGNAMLLTFKSDRTNTFPGFSASFSAYSYHQ
uniref:C-type LECtin n=1 Tax=Caenorhabditis tropicalis TaxID=1561998 RepID=A0A1I7U567_9PELO